MIVRQAADFFAQHGFGATTRELASCLGITQPLLYKYFSDKNALVDEVYKSVFLGVWDSAWDEILVDRSRRIEDRLVDFYVQYTDAIMNRGWMRIYLFAGLRNVGITSSYIRLVEERIIRRVSIEICAARNIKLTKENEARYFEIAWGLQGSIFYYGVRKHAYDLSPLVDKNVLIADVVGIFTRAWPLDVK